jgi:pyruvate ferredoxin oxidoreductase alpha subunit
MADTHSVIGTKNKKGQTFTDTWKMMNEAPRTPSFFTGSEVIKEALRRASCDVMIAYPITPQSEARLINSLPRVHRRLLPWRAEFAVMSQCAGSLRRGSVFTTTAGRHNARDGELSDGPARLPIQMIVTCRSINSPLSIQPDTEIAYLLNTGVLVWHRKPHRTSSIGSQGYMVSEA